MRKKPNYYRGTRMAAVKQDVKHGDVNQAIEEIFNPDTSIQPIARDASIDRPVLPRAETLDGFAASDVKMSDFPYTEFLAATFDRDRVITESICKAAFQTMDKDLDGKLSMG